LQGPRAKKQERGRKIKFGVTRRFLKPGRIGGPHPTCANCATFFKRITGGRSSRAAEKQKKHRKYA
jgi:hypothetical protein